MKQIIILSPNDNVAILTGRAAAGTTPLGTGVTLQSVLQAGHKIARTDIAKDAAILKFGQIIGYASQPIAAGEHVHTHNCSMGAHDQAYRIGTELEQARAAIPTLPARSFEGYRRADGSAGTRNFIALCATVNCSATVVRRAADAVNSSGLLADYPNVDGVVAFGHGTGCGMASEGIALQQSFSQ